MDLKYYFSVLVEGRGGEARLAMSLLCLKFPFDSEFSVLEEFLAAKTTMDLGALVNRLCFKVKYT